MKIYSRQPTPNALFAIALLLLLLRAGWAYVTYGVVSFQESDTFESLSEWNENPEFSIQFMKNELDRTHEVMTWSIAYPIFLSACIIYLTWLIRQERRAHKNKTPRPYASV